MTGSIVTSPSSKAHGICDALALIAGLADFVPFVGPILGAIPALVMAATQSMQALLITLAALALAALAPAAAQVDVGQSSAMRKLVSA